MKVNDYAKNLITKSKRRIVIWYILAILMLIVAVVMIAAFIMVPEIPDWAKELLGILIFASGQGTVCFLFLADFEKDTIKQIEYYVNVIKECEYENQQL